MADGQPLFELEGVGLTVGETTILDGIDLVLPNVGIVVLVGPSGSGKSTLLRLLNRLEAPTTGVVRYRGDDVSTLDPQQLRRQVGMVFQRPTVFDGTCLTNLQVADPTLDREGAHGVLGRVGLGPEVVERDARELSGGEAQRLCLARTLVTRPAIVLLDEPTSSLDAENVHTIEHLARDLADGGTRQVWVSHDRDQVVRLADWIVRLEDGRVVESGRHEAMGHVHDDDELWAGSPQAAEAGEEPRS